MTDQLDLFSTGQVRAHVDRDAADAARDAAIERVAAGQGDLIADLELVVLGIAGRYRDFTTDDVWLALGDTAEKLDEPRVLGAVIRTLVLKDKIRPTGLYRNSRRPACHSRPVKVWRATGERD
jgi:hypothetical protein